MEWEGELQFLHKISFPRSYVPASVDQTRSITDLQVFSDASESSYGAVAYLCTKDKLGKIHLSFVLARSRVAPKRVLSLPRLELCADVIGAQFTNLLKKELNLPLCHTVLWTDCTTVLSRSPAISKVFVDTRVADLRAYQHHSLVIHGFSSKSSR